MDSDPGTMASGGMALIAVDEEMMDPVSPGPQMGLGSHELRRIDACYVEAERSLAHIDRSQRLHFLSPGLRPTPTQQPEEREKWHNNPSRSGRNRACGEGGEGAIRCDRFRPHFARSRRVLTPLSAERPSPEQDRPAS